MPSIFETSRVLTRDRVARHNANALTYDVCNGNIYQMRYLAMAMLVLPLSLQVLLSERCASI